MGKKERRREAEAAAAAAEAAAAEAAAVAAAADAPAGDPDGEEGAEAAAARKAAKRARKAAKREAAAAAAAAEGGDAIGAAAATVPAADGAHKSHKRQRTDDAGAAAGGAGAAAGGPGATGVRKHFYTVPAAVHAVTASAVAAYRADKCIVVEDASGSAGDAYLPLSTWALVGEGVFTKAQLAVCAGFASPSPIQAQSWPIALSGRDMVGIAATGSGKTIAFLLPALVHIAGQPSSGGGGGGGGARGPAMLVLAPTRELAMQTASVAEAAGKACGLGVACVFGGVPKGPQIEALTQGRGAAIVIATPGRLLDLITTAAGVHLRRVTFLVLDEADRMLDMGFERDVRAILEAIPAAPGTRQTLMFSATWPEGVRKIADEFLVDPVKLVIGSPDLAASHSVTQVVSVLEPNARDMELLKLLEQYHGGAHGRKNRVIVFVLYKKEADRVAAFLAQRGWRNGAIHGDLSQDARTRAFLAFKAGTVPILVATDVAARGLDIPNVEFVINYSFPLTIEDYVHRIGRTGRAGKTGLAHTFFTHLDKAHSGELVNVLNEAGQTVPEELVKKFGASVKKKEHGMYGAHFKASNDRPAAKASKIVFDD